MSTLDIIIWLTIGFFLVYNASRKHIKEYYPLLTMDNTFLSGEFALRCVEAACKAQSKDDNKEKCKIAGVRRVVPCQ